jgi:hypothetical protein
MENSEFLSFFSGLSEENSNEEIMHSSQMIVNTLESKIKLEKKEHNHPDPAKYKLYLKICEFPIEDILYAFKRLVNNSI